jgi:hypothetical protein
VTGQTAILVGPHFAIKQVTCIVLRAHCNFFSRFSLTAHDSGKLIIGTGANGRCTNFARMRIGQGLLEALYDGCEACKDSAGTVGGRRRNQNNSRVVCGQYGILTNSRKSIPYVLPPYHRYERRSVPHGALGFDDATGKKDAGKYLKSSENRKEEEGNGYDGVVGVSENRSRQMRLDIRARERERRHSDGTS